MAERTLQLALNGEYFDAIRDGTKTEELRQITPYWAKRIPHRQYDRIVLTRGYPKGGGIEGVTRLTRRWNGYREASVIHRHFGPDPVRVYAIRVHEPVEDTRHAS